MLAMLAALVQLGGSSAAPGDPPNINGDWSAPFAWPIVAVHMSLTSTGEVFSLDGFGAALNSERVWNPQTGIFASVPYGRNLFCGGHVQLPDGRTLIVGGHIAAYEGLADTTLFNANTDTYFRGADMDEARWYPTATQMPDGKVLVYAGDRIVQNRPGQPHALEDASVNSLPELYNPANNTWTSLTSAQRTSPLYPQMFVLSDGRVIDVGPDTTTRILTPGSWTWSTLNTSPFDGHSAVMYRPNKIMKSGTWADPDFQGPLAYDTNGRTAVLDMNAPSPTWRETSPMGHGRAYHNMTLLPDGTVLASGGSSRSDGLDLSKSVLPAEIWNPDTETWTEVDALQNGRQYHSTALLLPDGRVLMAGGGAVGGGTDIKNGEIYSPPYLFKGPRPVITSSPASMSYGASFDVNTPNAAQIAKRLADSRAVGDARVRHEPALPVPQLHAGLGQGHRDGAGELEPRASRRLPALPRRHERRAVDRIVRPPEPGSALRRHDAPDGVGHRAGQRGNRQRDDSGHRERGRQRRGPGRAVQARRRGSRRRGHDRAVLVHLGHDDDAQRRAHDHRRRA